jgi:hypothetical protein
MRPFFFSLFTVFFLLPCFAGTQGQTFDDIPPKKGDITKNIHVIFDKSGSMSVSDFRRGYKEVEMLAMQGTDEYNLALTVFANGSSRLKVKDPDCKLKPNWMSMPSAIHAQRLVPWIQKSGVDDSETILLPVIKKVFEENKKNVTIIVISDCIIPDGVEALDYIKTQKSNKKTHDIKIGFVNVGGSTGYVSVYRRIKKDGHWYIGVKEEDK